MADPNRAEAREPSPPPVPQQQLPAGPPPRPARRHRLRWRQVLLVIVLAGGLLLVGGVGYGFILYNQATKPDRSAPDVVVDNYLRSLLVERDNVRAGLYACRDEARLAEIRALRDDLLSREQQYDITIRVTWGALAVRTEGDRASVTTNLVRTISDGSEQSIQAWRFEVVDQDGWRVCGAARAS